nr:ribonuclease III domain-containing protein [uncultured Holophaga sp.]
MVAKHEYADLEQRLGYQFKDPVLLLQALTPVAAGLPEDNQRLEFLGDAVLQLCMSQLIVRLQPTWREGPMSKLRGMLVCTDSLIAWARDLGLELRKGPRSLRRKGDDLAGKPMADALEALLAAVYLDREAQGQSGLEAALQLVARRFETPVREAYEGVWARTDTKTALQERAAALGLPHPQYEQLDQSGPAHAPVFKVRVSVGDCLGIGEARSLKAAQAEAARAALEVLGGNAH